MHFSGWRLSYMKFYWCWEKVCWPWAIINTYQLPIHSGMDIVNVTVGWKTVVSSAKWTKRIWFEDLYMLLIYKRKSTGPNTDPCGTPNVMFDIEELQFSIETYCFLLVKYDSNQCCMTPLCCMTPEYSWGRWICSSAYELD